METAWLLPDLANPTAGRVLGQAARAASCSCRRARRAGCGACRPGRCARAAGRSTCAGSSHRDAAASGRSSFPIPRCCPAFAEVAPYNAIIVELEEDPAIRFAGNLVTGPDGEINEIDPATITIGEPVTVVFHRIDDVSLPRWTRP